MQPWLNFCLSGSHTSLFPNASPSLKHTSTSRMSGHCLGTFKTRDKKNMFLSLPPPLSLLSLSLSLFLPFSVYVSICVDHLCGLVVRVLDYRYRGPGFDSRALPKKVVGLERGPLSLSFTFFFTLHCLDNRLTDGGKVLSLMYRPHSTPQKHYFSASGTHLCYRLSEPQSLARPKGLGKLETIHLTHRVSNPQPSGL
jgi:hypothetical protein